MQWRAGRWRAPCDGPHQLVATLYSNVKPLPPEQCFDAGMLLSIGKAGVLRSKPGPWCRMMRAPAKVLGQLDHRTE